MCSFDGLGAFSVRLDDPAAASRPFDATNAMGWFPAAVRQLLFSNAIVWHSNVVPLFSEKFLGYGFLPMARTLSVPPSRDGLGRAMRMALDDSGLAAAEIDYLCAHATSTPAGDAAEAENIRRVFGARTPPISALKAMTGHELWMSGASQVVYTTIMAQQGFTAASKNFQRPCDETRGLNILREPLPCGPKRALCNSAGFGGTNASLVIGFD